MSNSVDLEELKKLCEMATPGPWSYDQDAEFYQGDDEYAQSYINIGDARWSSPVPMTGGDAAGLTNDAEFIAAARTAIPKLIAEIERLKALVEKEPDYCYDAENWEFTASWDDRCAVHGYGQGLDAREIRRVGTLVSGPDMWIAAVPPLTDDDDGGVEWFDTEEEAKAALQSGGINGKSHAAWEAKLDRDMDDYGPDCNSDD